MGLYYGDSATRMHGYCRAGLLLSLAAYLLAFTPGYGQTPYNFLAGIAKYRLALKTAKTNAERAGLYFQLANNYSVTNEDSAAFFARQGVAFAEKLPDKHLLVLLYGELGRSYESSGNIAEGLSILKKAESIGQQYLKDSTTATIQLMLANFYNKQGDKRQALPKALDALRYIESHNPDKKVLLCKVYNSLGIIYTDIKDYRKALFYLEKQRAVGASVLGGFYVYLSSINMSDIYMELGEYDKAEAAARVALAKARELKSNRGTGFGYGQLAEVMLKTHRYQQALDYGQQALQIRQQHSDKRLIGISLISMAEIYAVLNQNGQALDQARQGVAVLRTTNDRVTTRKGLEIEAELLEKTGDYRQALLTYKAAKGLNDSLMNVDNAREVSRIQGTFDLERKQNQIQLLNKNLAIQQLRGIQRQKQLLLSRQAQHAGELKNQLLTRQQQLTMSQLALQAVATKRQQTLITQQQRELTFAQRQRLLYLTILVLLIGLISLISYFFSRQQKAKRVLSRQNEEIQQQAHQLAELNVTKDKLFSIISHDLRGPVASMKTDFRQIRETDGQFRLLSPLLNRLENRVDTVLNLLTNLLDWSMTQLKGFRVLMQPVLLHDIMEETIRQASESIQQKQLRLINQVDPAHTVLADRHQLRIIIRNLLGNAIKFTPEDGFIRIQSLVEGDFIELHIRDSGLGMAAWQLKKLFTEPEIRTGTAGEVGMGLGLRLCRELIARQQGTLHVECSPRGGTQVRIRLAAFAGQPQPMPVVPG